MERYLLYPPEDRSIDWSALLTERTDVRLIYVFPSGTAYITTSPEACERLKEELPGLKTEIIARHGR